MNWPQTRMINCPRNQKSTFHHFYIMIFKVMTHLKANEKDIFYLKHFISDFLNSIISFIFDICIYKLLHFRSATLSKCHYINQNRSWKGRTNCEQSRTIEKFNSIDNETTVVVAKTPQPSRKNCFVIAIPLGFAKFCHDQVFLQNLRVKLPTKKWFPEFTISEENHRFTRFKCL